MLKRLLVAAAIVVAPLALASPASATTNIDVLDGHCVADVDNLLGINLDVLCGDGGHHNHPTAPPVLPLPPVIVHVPAVPPVVVNVPPVVCVAVNSHCPKPPVHHHPKPPVTPKPTPKPPVITPTPTELPHTGAGDPWFAGAALALILGGVGATFYAGRKNF